MSDSVLEISIHKIETALRGLGKSEITGARLGELIRKVAADLNVREVTGIYTGAGAVRKFVENHLQECLRKSGKQGSDLVYEIISSDSETAGFDSPKSKLWLAFVRTGSAEIILLDRGSFELEVMDSSSQIDHDGKFVIENASEKELNDIRSSFVAEIALSEPEVAAQLEVSLPYAVWSSTLKRVARNKAKEWSNFRIEKIIDIFSARLAALGVEDAMAKRLCSELRYSQNAANAASLAQRNLSLQERNRNPISADTLSSVDTSISIREAVIHAVSGMSDAELRELRLPVGAIFDALLGKVVKK